jgi:hypothetical protein
MNIYEQGISHIMSLTSPILRALLVFLWMSRVQFFYDGNKHTARIIANGVLLSHGYPPLHIRATDQLDYNTTLVDFYTSGHADPTLDWLISYYMRVSREMGWNN